MKATDPYKKHKHTSSFTTLTVEKFAIDGIPVCMSWSGCAKHPRMACQFLLVRRMGSIKVCGLTGQDLDEFPDVINPVPASCPIYEINNKC